MHFSPVPVTSSFLGPNILPSALFSNNFTLCPSLRMERKFWPVQNSG
jgi:hypothetical protein